MPSAEFFRTAPTQQLRLLRLPQLLEIVPLSKRRIDQLEQAGEFPRRVALGANAIAWNEHEVRQWLAARLEQRVQAPEERRLLAGKSAPPARPIEPARERPGKRERAGRA